MMGIKVPTPPTDLLSRRQALARLGLATVGAYVVPETLLLSQARASSSASLPSDPSDPSDSSDPSDPSVPTPPTPPSAPSDIEDTEQDVTENDNCKGAKSTEPPDRASIDQRDYEKSVAAVEAGYAKPLNQIWADITAAYPGRIIKIEFTGFRWRPRYRLRAISTTGRLETVIVSARTGQIVRIVGC